MRLSHVGLAALTAVGLAIVPSSALHQGISTPLQEQVSARSGGELEEFSAKKEDPKEVCISQESNIAFISFPKITTITDISRWKY